MTQLLKNHKMERKVEIELFVHSFLLAGAGAILPAGVLLIPHVFLTLVFLVVLPRLLDFVLEDCP